MYFTSTTQITLRQSSLMYLVFMVMMTSLRLRLFQHYADVVGPKPSRQNRGNRSLKEKEVGDIMEAIKKLDESGPARPVIFVAVNLTNLPSIMLPTVLSTSNNRTINDDDNVRHRLTTLEMQMAEMLAAKSLLLRPQHRGR